MITLPWGVDAGGRTLKVPLGASTLIGGLPGAGKSSTMRAMLGAATCRPDVAFALIDPKVTELTPWRARASLFATDPDAAGDVLEALLRLIDARYQAMGTQGYDLWPTGPATPHVLVAVDELAELFDAGDGADKERSRMLRRTVSKGRAAGVTVVAATQRPSADIVPTSLRDLFAFRICHATATAESSEMVLGPSWELGPAHRLPISPTHAGLAYALMEGQRAPVLSRALWLPPGLVRSLVTDSPRPYLYVPAPEPVAIASPSLPGRKRSGAGGAPEGPTRRQA